MADPLELPGLEPIAAVVAELAAAFNERGHRLYLVGGVVRDLLLGQTSMADDIDLTTDAGPDVIKTLVRPMATALWTQGERFGTIGATIDGRDLEITTHRAEAYEPGSRKPIVAFGDSLAEDLSRRDFTMNAMAISVPDQVLFDPYEGRSDLTRRRLATPRSPAVSFSDDPLRMMRAARFLPRFDLSCEPGLEVAATELAARLAIVSVERIHDEFERLLALNHPGEGLSFLQRTGLLAQVFPAFTGERDHERSGVAVASLAPTPLTRRAGLLVPLGPEGAADGLQRLRYPRAVVSQTVDLIGALALATGDDPDAPAVRRMVARVGIEGVAELRALAALQGPEPPVFAHYDRLAEREDLSDLRSALSGREVMDRLDIGPSSMVGAAVAHLTNERIERGPLSPEEARISLDRWWAELAPGQSE